MKTSKQAENKKDRETRELINQWLSQYPSIEMAILFGSFAKRTSTPKSDIDIAIALDKPLSIENKLNLLQAFSELTDQKIDLIDLKTVGEPLLNQIIQHGELLKGTITDLAQLSIKNVNMMQDFTPYLEKLLKERRARLLYE